MGAPTGNYSRDMYARDKQYIRLSQQQRKPVADADENDGQKITYNLLREFIASFAGATLFIGTGLKVAGAGLTNNFNVTQGMAYLNGNPAWLGSTVAFVNDGSSISKKNLHSISTNLTDTVLTDSSMCWAVNELVGRKLVPDITDGTEFTVVSNTRTTITVAPGSTMLSSAAPGDSYLLKPTTPAAPRADSVWLNLYLDEIGSAQDPALIHNVRGGIELQRRIKARTVIMVQEGASSYSNYTDADGNDHYMTRLATFARAGLDSVIDTGDVTDTRTNAEGVTGPSDRTKVSVSPQDTTPGNLQDKLSVDETVGLTLTKQGTGANESLKVGMGAGGGAVGICTGCASMRVSFNGNAVRNTLYYADFNVVTGAITLSNAGHLSASWIRRNPAFPDVNNVHMSVGMAQTWSYDDMGAMGDWQSRYDVVNIYAIAPNVIRITLYRGCSHAWSIGSYLEAVGLAIRM